MQRQRCQQDHVRLCNMAIEHIWRAAHAIGGGRVTVKWQVASSSTMAYVSYMRALGSLLGELSSQTACMRACKVQVQVECKGLSSLAAAANGRARVCACAARMLQVRKIS